MEKLVAYKRMPLWNKQTMPEAVQQKHNTKVGTWENYCLEGSSQVY